MAHLTVLFILLHDGKRLNNIDRKANPAQNCANWVDVLTAGKNKSNVVDQVNISDINAICDNLFWNKTI